MFKLSANLALMFPEYDELDRIGAAAEAGFKGVEWPFPYQHSAERVAEELRKYNVEMVLIDFPAGNWAAGERGIACLSGRIGEFHDGVKQAIEYADTLGCKNLTVLTGVAPDEQSTSRYLGTLKDNLKYACDRAEKRGMTVLLEAVNNSVDIPHYLVNSTALSAEIVSEVGKKNLKLQCDLYHMQIMEGDLARKIELHKDLIGHFQLADNPGRNEPGTGEINYDFLLNFIAEQGYDGWIGCEYIPKGKDTLSGLGWAKKWL